MANNIMIKVYINAHHACRYAVLLRVHARVGIAVSAAECACYYNILLLTLS